MKDLRAFVAELIATFALCFIGAGAIVTNSYSDGAVGLVGIALAHGVVLAIMINATGHISGAHVNPAVTIGFMITKRIEVGKGIGYIISQLAGGVLAAFWRVLPCVPFLVRPSGARRTWGRQLLIREFLLELEL